MALSNLPNFTVKNIKVYDKEADDEYLKKEKRYKIRTEEEQNLVMDVNLKREYSTGWTSNVEAGGGTESRYRLRGFLLGYNDNLRISVFGNANNVGESDLTAGSTWSESDIRSNMASSPYLRTVKKGGIDYNYENKKKFKLYGNVTGGTDKNNSDAVSASTQFFQSGDLYNRAVGFRNSGSNRLTTNHQLRITGKNVFFSFSPSLDWRVGDNASESRRATFSQNPSEQFRGEAIDSLFAHGSSSRYYRNMLTRLYSGNVGHNSNLDASYSMAMTYSTEKMNGSLTVSSSGRYHRSPGRSRGLSLQNLGPEASSQMAPVRTDRYSDTDSRNRSINLIPTYNYTKFFTTHGQNLTVGASASAEYSYSDQNSLYSLMKAEAESAVESLPSLTTPEGALHDFENSYNSRTAVNSLTSRLNLSFSTNPEHRGDSTFNASYNLNFSLSEAHQHERYYYEKPTVMTENLRRTTDFLIPSVSVSLYSFNKVRSITLHASMSVSKSAPALSRMVQTVNSSDPLNIYLPAPEGMKNSTTYFIHLNFSRYSRGSNNARFTAGLSGNVSNNVMAMARTYNPETGVSIYQPATINGNWTLNGNTDYSIQAGSRKQLEITGRLRVRYNNSADYAAIDAEPVKSVVRNWTVSPHIGVGYRIARGGTIAADAGMTWNTASSSRPGFSAISSRTYNAKVEAHIKLPAKLTLRTAMFMELLRGYTDESMNTSSWIWNLSVARSFLKGNALTLRLSGFDILKSVKQIVTTVNAQGRTESWYNSLPRYIMITAAYRFDMKPKKHDTKN